MDLGELRKYINYFASKENKGNTITPEEFSDRLRDACIEYVINEYKFYEIDQKSRDTLGYIEVVRGKNTSPISVKNGIAYLPDDYFRVSSISCYINGEYKNVDILSDSEFRMRKSSWIIKPEKHPFCVIRYDKNAFNKNYIEILPESVNMIEMSYLKRVPTPYYDYCIGNDTFEEVFMPVGSYIDIDNNLYSEGNTLLYENVAHLTGTPKYTSKTVELVFPEDVHYSIARIILSYIGVNLRDQELYQINENNKMMENVGR